MRCTCRILDTTGKCQRFMCTLDSPDLFPYDDDSVARAARTRLYDKASPTDSREWRPCTRRRTCLLQDSTGTGRANKHSQAQRRQLPSESARTRLLESRRRSFGRECTLEAEADHEAIGRAHSGPHQERPMSGTADVTSQSDYRSSGTNDFHEQRAEAERTTRRT